MIIKPLLTHEIGSLEKPVWRTKAFRNITLNEDDIQYAERWGKFLQIENLDDLIKILNKKANFNKEEKETILNFSSLFAISLLEKAGIDYVYDGEQHRIEMYEHPVKNISGFVFKGNVRSFDNKYYKKASLEDKPELLEDYHIKEFKKILSLAKKPVKIPVTGAYTLVDWSYDEFYLKNILPGEENIREKKKEAKINFISQISKEVIHKILKSLCDNNAEFIQIDEPAATTKRDEIGEFLNSIKDSIGDLKGKAFFSVHICFSDYSLLFPQIKKLEGVLNELHFEYANRDSTEPGINEKNRRGYEILKKISDTNFIVGLGVLDVHTDFIEPPELIRDRILYAVKVLKDPKRIFVAPDCGLRTRTWDIVFSKLKNMVIGKELAEKELGLA